MVPYSLNSSANYNYFKIPLLYIFFILLVAGVMLLCFFCFIFTGVINVSYEKNSSGEIQVIATCKDRQPTPLPPGMIPDSKLPKCTTGHTIHKDVTLVTTTNGEQCSIALYKGGGRGRGEGTKQGNFVSGFGKIRLITGWVKIDNSPPQ